MVDKAWEKAKLSSPLNRKSRIMCGYPITGLGHGFNSRASPCLTKSENESHKNSCYKNDTTQGPPLL